MTDQGTVEGGLDEPTELEPEQGTLELAGAEDRWSVADWEAAAAGVLRKSRRLGEDDPDSLVWDKLARTTLDGIAITPLGTPRDLEGLTTSGRPTRTGAWDVRAHHPRGDAAAVNEDIRGDLAGGVTSVWVETTDGADLGTLLDGVHLDMAAVVLDATEPLAAARAFLSYAGARDLAPGTGLGVPATSPDLVAAARLARDASILAAVVDATRVHDRGASDVQELAWSLKAGADALRTLADAGFAVDESAGLLEFRYAATDEQFPTIAKLRAARRLWARVLDASGVAGGEQRQHAVTSRPMMTKYDPYVNMLRGTVAAFAAGVGGAEAVTVLPFDARLGRPEEFGRRIARNTSHLLISESHVAKVADPAGGAYAVERLTDELARAAWELFGRLDDGEALDPLIEETVARREEEVARRTRPITGVSEFPHAGETLPERAPLGDEGAWGDVRPYAASFEALRDEPAAQRVFLATLGPVAQHTARATFATNLLAAGGIAVDVAGPTRDADELAAAYSGQPVVCLAGADTTYAEWGRSAAERLRAAGARHVIIAGKPTDWVDDSCAMGVDALDFLHRTREKLG